MTERRGLLESIASTIKDYRAGEIEAPSAGHVDRWVRQFDNSVQVALLREVDHVFKETYFSKEWVSGFLAKQIKNEKLAGSDSCAFWRSARFLRIQQYGHSQAELLALFGESLKAQCGIAIERCGRPDGPFIYLDDVLFSGSRVGNDISEWLKQDAPATATLHILVIATHCLGEWQALKGLKKDAAAVGKKIEL